MRIGLIGAGRIGAFHAATLCGLPAVTEVAIADVDPARARAVADAVGAVAVDSVAALFACRPDGIVIAAPTAFHPALIDAAVRAQVPVFCEKPIAADVPGTRATLAKVAAAGVALQVGFQRRFDAGYRGVRDAIRSGSLGWLHTLRACTCDPAPPPPAYLPTSGGIFRDCSVHDFDAVRWATGREVVEVYATGANRSDAAAGAKVFGRAGDVDTGAVVLTLDDGTLALCSATRFNGAGYDARLEACGAAGTLVAGLDDSVPLPSAEPGVDWPAGSPYSGFLQRFRGAYIAELAAFCEVAAGRADNPCTGHDALAALLVAEAADRSWRERRTVALAELEVAA